MTVNARTNDLHGKTLRFVFEDGPKKGKSFDHVFDRKGSVAWSEVGGKTMTSEHAGIEAIGDGCHAASYLGSKGFTLSTTFNLDTGKLVSFAFDGKEWSVHHGRIELKA